MKGSGLKPLEEPKTNEEVHVFGRNLEERVVTNVEAEESSPSLTFDTNPTCHTQDDDIESIRKRKFDAITGEEDEETIFQGDFKLFVWDLATSNWIEKGRGQLKLNDSIDTESSRSRIIMRIGGTLRIILNVAISKPFFKVIANSKTNIRFTDSQTVWAASGSNAHQLRDLIDERLKMIPDEQEKSDNGELRKKTKADSNDTENSSEVPSEKEKKLEESEASTKRQEDEDGGDQKEENRKTKRRKDSEEKQKDSERSDQDEKEEAGSSKSEEQKNEEKQEQEKGDETEKREQNDDGSEAELDGDR